MKVQVLCFGITKEIMGGFRVEIDVSGDTIEHLKNKIHEDYPQLKDLKSLKFAVNETYADGTYSIKPTDELALIPPVSGG